MKLIEIYSGLIWSVCYEGEKKDTFSKLFRHWTDVEYLTKFITKNQRLLSNNIFFAGLSVKDVIMNALNEAINFNKDFTRYYWNEINGEHPNLDDRFVILNRRAGRDDLKREMYGHPKDDTKMTSVFRLYAVKVPSEKKEEPPAYVITGGGIKLSDSMPQMKELAREYTRIETVQGWLEQNKISTKEQLIDFQTKYAEQANDRMGKTGAKD